MTRIKAAAAALLLAGGGGGAASAQTATFVPFDQFVASLSAASTSAQVAKPQSQVPGADASQQMRSHLVGLYAGMTVKHSFVLAAHTYDCVPIMQQPSVRQLGLQSIAPAPVLPPSSPQQAGQPQGEAMPPQIDPAQKTDSFGNAMGCEAGTIPMSRVAPTDVGRFGTLSKFFRKDPTSSPTPQRPDPAQSPQTSDDHKYSYGYQYVTNLGGTTDINVWDPKVDTSQGQVFSLAQFWYINTNGAIQTVEAGVQNYPDLYGDDQSHLFVYWTSDNYQSVGCYNLTCPGFVQTNGNVVLGGPVPQVSTLLGQQYYARLSALNQGGNWWIYLGGTDASHAIGYYPASVFNGQPITQSANLIEYGGEVVGSTTWPQMGSGSYAQARFRHAASQKQISYYPTTSPSDAVQANLNPLQPSIGCYTNVTSNSSGYNGWNSFFYFGGPGGSGC